MIVLSGLTYFSRYNNNSRVAFADVQHSVDLKLDPVIKIQAAAPESTPGVVKNGFSGNNPSDFIDWMNGLDDSHKKKFIADLEPVYTGRPERQIPRI